MSWIGLWIGVPVLLIGAVIVGVFAQTYIAQHNAAFAVAAEQEGSGFLHDRTGAWPEILCIQEERTVGNDNTVKWSGLSLQLPQSRLRPHFVKAVVRVHEYPNGAIAVFL